MYQVKFTPQGEKDLTRLDKSVVQRILKRLRWLSENFDNLHLELLSGPWQGVYKLRVGEYRILYTINKSESFIIVHFVRHRSEVYK